MTDVMLWMYLWLSHCDLSRKKVEDLTCIYDDIQLYERVLKIEHVTTVQAMFDKHILVPKQALHLESSRFILAMFDLYGLKAIFDCLITTFVGIILFILILSFITKSTYQILFKWN